MRFRTWMATAALGAFLLAGCGGGKDTQKTGAADSSKAAANGGDKGKPGRGGERGGVKGGPKDGKKAGPEKPPTPPPPP